MVNLKKDVQFIKSVGPNRVALLNKLNIHSVGDLITYFPRDYQDRSKPKNICECIEGQEVLIEAMPIARMSEYRTNRITISKLMLRDETGTCTAIWFNQTYLKNKFEPGKNYRFFGKITNKNGILEMQAPAFDNEGETKNTGKIVPIYPLTRNLSQNVLRGIMQNAMDEVYGNLEETLPQEIINEYNLMELNEAIKKVHFPEELEEFKQARTRLAFEELLIMQLALLELKNKYAVDMEGIEFSKEAKMSDVINILPFKLTKAQLRVLEEIDRDMENKKPMNRLLQGDVGSGKTAVAIIAAYKAVKSGYQAAILAPTAILASQHLESFREMLDKFGIRCELLMSSVTAKKKKEILLKLENGEIDILIGTHAIIEENVVFKNLGLVVTDEQHRFGVKQRTKIVEKGQTPDVLVMSATPIPRTLGLILYGDLDISIIDELPPNRKKVETYAVKKNMEERVNNFIKEQIKDGRQVYIVCPLVEESEEFDLKSVVELAEKYKTETFNEFKVEYLHGKMKNKEKDEIMQRFKNGEIEILISTTVIEVGVNVPNASLMIVENAERFGLAQLHQLRGRVGRGEYKSYCILKYDKASKNTKERMEIMTQTNDGFLIAEKDLQLRGSGDFFGTEQHGIPEFKIANLFEDIEILKMAQELAGRIIHEDPLLELEKNSQLNLKVMNKFGNRIDI
ncbi:MAG: ATP-dependent DNA helicase RecG [Clostridia bacterium]|nr:ATP-dependent DNA helicase RecG [Clostridia bacterium]